MKKVLTTIIALATIMAVQAAKPRTSLVVKRLVSRPSLVSVAPVVMVP